MTLFAILAVELIVAVVIMFTHAESRKKVITGALAFGLLAVVYDTYRAALVADEEGGATGVLGVWWFAAFVALAISLAVVEAITLVGIKNGKKK